jgi:DNA-binding PadR family transcriptional regulator
LLLEDPSREVWPYYVDQRSPARGDSYAVLKRLAGAGWLTARREADTPNARVLYRLTPSGEALAREAVERPVKWPADVSRRRHGERRSAENR